MTLFIIGLVIGVVVGMIAGIISCLSFMAGAIKLWR
jgi:hypothetical protein